MTEDKTKEKGFPQRVGLTSGLFIIPEEAIGVGEVTIMHGEEGHGHDTCMSL